LDDFTPKDKIRPLPSLAFVETPIARQIGVGAVHCVEYVDIALFMSDPGAGKTKALTQLAATRPNTFYLCANNIQRSSPAVLSRLCEEMDVWCRAERATLMRAAIGRALEQRGPGVLFLFDEAQHFDDGVFETLRGIHDEFGVPMAFAANYDMPGRLSKNLPQLESRIGFKNKLIPTREDMEAIATANGVTEKKALDLLWGIALAQRTKVRDSPPLWRGPSLRIPCKTLNKAKAIAGHETAPTVEHIQQAMIEISEGLRHE